MGELGSGAVVGVGVIFVIGSIATALVARKSPSTYVVRLHTAGLQTDALKSNKPDLPNAVAAALNDAIIRRA